MYAMPANWPVAVPDVSIVAMLIGSEDHVATDEIL